MEIELEKTYLVRVMPDLNDFDFSLEMRDTYIPIDSDHPQMRLRQQGVKLFLTKKIPVVGGEGFEEYTIPLSKEEYAVFKKIKGRVLAKTRHVKLMSSGVTCHLDIYKENLEGLVVVDFEFNSEKVLRNFKAPDYTLVEIHKKGPLAGGLLAGRSFSSLEKLLEKEYGY